MNSEAALNRKSFNRVHNKVIFLASFNTVGFSVHNKVQSSHLIIFISRKEVIHKYSFKILKKCY